MAKTSCLAGIAAGRVAALSTALHEAGASVPPVIAQLRVAELGRLSPAILICDIDRLPPDALEMLRQLRFVLPECLITIITAKRLGSWALACHLAGANCVLSSESSDAEITAGLHRVLQSGCYTDPRFAEPAAA